MSTVPDNTAPKTLAPIPPIFLDQIKALCAKAGRNPATLEFPTDRWGFTSRIKKEVLLSASQVKGQDDKHDLLIGTLAVLMAHVKARKESDAADRLRLAQLQDEARAERLPRERVSAPAVPKPVED